MSCYCCRAALLGNTVPVAFGAIGIPTTTLASLVKIDQQILAQAITRLLLPISFIQPFLIVYAVSDWRGVLGAWPVCLFTCIVQTGMALVMAEFVGAYVVADHVGWMAAVLACECPSRECNIITVIVRAPSASHVPLRKLTNCLPACTPMFHLLPFLHFLQDPRWYPSSPCWSRWAAWASSSTSGSPRRSS